jgi:imidazole glycerol phosphate synthase subunit HisF
LDSLIINDIDEVKKISNKIGSQALIASLPLNIMNNSLFYFNYISSQSIKAMPLIKSILTKNIISEFFVTDYKHEGLVDTFDENIITLLSNIEIPLILFGGITSPKFIKSALSMKNISAIAIGNMLNYKEHSLQTLRKNINSNKLRKSTYSGKIDI